MTVTSRRHRAALLASGLIVVGGLVACGSDSSGGAGPGVPGSGSGSTPAVTTGFCGQLGQSLSVVLQDPTAALPADAGPARWKAHFDLTRTRLTALAAAAPSDLAGALTDLRTVNDRIAAVYQSAGYDPAKIDTGMLTQLLGDGGYGSAADAVSTYAQDTCHLATGDPSTEAPADEPADEPADDPTSRSMSKPAPTSKPAPGSTSTSGSMRAQGWY